MKRFLVAILMALIVMGTLFAGGSPEQAAERYPERAITLIVAANTGGDNDQVSRILAPALTRVLGTSVVVQNMAGNGGNVALQYLVDSDPDGYQIYIENSNVFTSQVTGRYIYDFDSEFEPVCTFAKSDSQILVVASSSNITTADAMAEAIRTNPRTVKFAATLGAPSQFHAVATEDAMNGEFRKIDTGSGSDKLVALLSGEVDVVSSTQSLVKDYVTAGQITVVGSICNERSQFAPDTPTFKELGYDLGPDFSAVYSIWVKKGTPDLIKDKIADAVAQVMTNPDTLSSFERLLYSADVRDREETAEWYKAAKERWFAMKEAVDNDIW